MNKVVVCAALLTVGVCDANAQNSVTLYGRIASGLDFVTNVATSNGPSVTNFRFGSDQYGISWWGLTGKEDLGGGLDTEFKLESMFTAGTGQLPGQNLFNRFAYVGLGKDGWGSLWAGLAMSLTDETEYYVDPLGLQSATGIANFDKSRGRGPRPNTLTYNSPKWSGFSFRLQNGFGNEAGNFRASRQLSASFAYSTGHFSAYGVYEEIRDANGNFSDPYDASREYLIGGTYQLGAMKLYTGYEVLASSGQHTVASSDNPTGSTRNQQEWLGASYQVNAALAFQAAWYHGKANHGGGGGNLGAIGTTYNLSKRTLLYATFGAMFNGGNANFPVETSDSLPLPGHNQQGGYFGIMHYF